MRLQLSIRQRLAFLLGVLGTAVSMLAVLHLFGVGRQIVNGAALAVIAFTALSSSLLARGFLRELAQLTAELTSLRAEKEAMVVKKGRGRRDAFNEILLGLEARADEVQRDRDNLEQLVAQRTLALQRRNEAMRLVLDNVQQGLATIELDGKLSSERSRAFDDWFRFAPASATAFEDRLSSHDDGLRRMLRLAWEQLVEGILPLEVLLDQMPKRLDVDARHYALDYRAILEDEILQGALLVVTDITDEMERVQRDAEQRELISLFEGWMRDRRGFMEFFQECDALLKTAFTRSTTLEQTKRIVHTIKGNCGLFGLTSVADVAHRLEGMMAERGELPTSAELSELDGAWHALSDRLQRMAGGSNGPIVDVAYDELEELLDATSRRAPHSELHKLIERMKHERVAPRLHRAGEQAHALARRLGKAELNVEVCASNQMRLPVEQWAPFWTSFAHVIRNAVDHGLEPAQERRAAGKPEAGNLRLSAFTDAQSFRLEIVDDGPGVDWARVRQQAAERGLPHETESDLVDALFADGLSTARAVSDVSGRGVGMGAVREAVRALGGTIGVRSKPGEGTSFQFVFPLAQATQPGFGAQRPAARSNPSVLVVGAITAD